MITRDQFLLQVERLVDTFGERHFPDQRAHMIWESIKDLEYNQVIEIVSGFIRSAKHAPLPVDFSTAANEITKGQRQTFALGEIQPKGVAKCHDCGDSGFVRIIRNETFEDWAKWNRGSAPCHCGRGLELVSKLKFRAKSPMDLGPQFNDAWLTSYHIDKAIEPLDGVFSGRGK